MSIQHLRSLCEKLYSSPIENKVSPISHPRRAGVAAILRWNIDGEQSDELLSTLPTPLTSTLSQDSTLTSFINQMDSVPGELELLFIQRAKRPGDLWSGQVAFPGGKNEENETDMETAMREVEEEIGLDLGGQDFLHLGKLNDKEITSLENKFMMILVPFVFLQISVKTPPLTIQPAEVAAVHWVSLHYLVSTPTTLFDPFGTHIPDTQRILKNPRPGIVKVPSLTLPTASMSEPDDSVEEPVILWGLTLHVTQQLIGFASNQLQEDSLLIAYSNPNKSIIKSRL
ncbi:NUDIX hydrolase domain-like protein [Absidia repens]|uniref:NUDIX hydrolase domain-like protein n=1 Tax=Absidia repens TaxID=90262 RepID=A0A1X2ICL8_9FUNG|nr:NUDIX hydrolase domain-like protein [Absidia repens]